MTKFTTTQNKGFQMKFENGFKISVQWGTMNYCEKKNLGADFADEMKKPFWESSNAEIAVFDKDGDFVSLGKDDAVIGWVSVDSVAKCISIVQSSTTEKEIETKIKSLNLCY
mgnify:CR=1 FL=1|tara:strand:- start:206 stop:541 length:336 start_codon:yes stop_codon:yes gene_type:complete